MKKRRQNLAKVSLFLLVLNLNPMVDERITFLECTPILHWHLNSIVTHSTLPAAGCELFQESLSFPLLFSFKFKNKRHRVYSGTS